LTDWRSSRGHFENLNHEHNIVYFWILGYGDGRPKTARRKAEIGLSAGRDPRCDRARTKGGEGRETPKATGPSDRRAERLKARHVRGGSERNPGGELSGGKLYYFFLCNPLKSPDRPKESKEIQAFFLGFVWIGLEAARPEVVF
jgi:hypothetical protein